MTSAFAFGASTAGEHGSATPAGFVGVGQRPCERQCDQRP